MSDYSKVTINGTDHGFEDTTGRGNLVHKADIVMDTASGPIASFPDGADNVHVSDLKVGIVPVQDLHGYDNPWPAGSTKNKMPSAPAKTETINGVTFTSDGNGIYTVKGTATADANCYFDLSESFVILNGPDDAKPRFAIGNSQSLSSATWRFYNGNTQIDSWSLSPANRTATYSSMRGKTCNKYAILVANGATVNMTIKPMILANDVTDYTFVPYSNLCPITGWTQANVSRTGKNLLCGVVKKAISIENNKFIITNAAGTTLIARCEAGKTYTWSGVETNRRFIGYYNHVPVAGDSTDYHEMLSSGETFTAAHDGYVAIYVYNAVTSYTSAQVEEGHDATSYEPFGTTIPISWQTEAGTVYGGELDVTTGTLTVTMASVDLGALTWGYTATSRFYNVDAISGFKRASNSSERATGVICSAYKPSTNLAFNDNQDDFSWLRGQESNVFDVYIKDSRYTDATVFKNALSGVQLVYELATPTTVTLTPTELTTLLGENRIFADTGDVTVTYAADTKLFIDKAFTELQAMILEN